MNEKLQIIKLIKKSKLDNERKLILFDFVNLIVNNDISETKNLLKTLNSNKNKDNLTKDNGLLNKLENKKVKVRTKEDLRHLIIETMKKEGKNCDLNFVDTSLITDMSYLFKGLSFNGDISKWDVSNVERMSQMFDKQFTDSDDFGFDSDISKWDVSNVREMICMFHGSKFNQNISKWNISNVKRNDEMFKYSPLENNPKYQPKFKR